MTWWRGWVCFPGGQGVAGSNPAVPTVFRTLVSRIGNENGHDRSHLTQSRGWGMGRGLTSLLPRGHHQATAGQRDTVALLGRECRCPAGCWRAMGAAMAGGRSAGVRLGDGRAGGGRLVSACWRVVSWRWLWWRAPPLRSAVAGARAVPGPVALRGMRCWPGRSRAWARSSPMAGASPCTCMFPITAGRRGALGCARGSGRRWCCRAGSPGHGQARESKRRCWARYGAAAARCRRL